MLAVVVAADFAAGGEVPGDDSEVVGLLGLGGAAEPEVWGMLHTANISPCGAVGSEGWGTVAAQARKQGP